MTFSRFVLLTASIAAAVAFAPALAQGHEVGHWWPTPVGVTVHDAAWPSFSGGVSVAAGDVSGDGHVPGTKPSAPGTVAPLGIDAHAAKQFNGFVSRFPAGSRSGEVHATPLEDPRLQVRDARQEGRHYDVTLKRGTTATPGSGDMTLKGQNILQNAPESRPVDPTGPAREKVKLPSLPSAGAGGSAHWMRMAQPHTTGSVAPPRVGWEVPVDSVPKTAGGVSVGATPSGHAARTRR